MQSKSVVIRFNRSVILLKIIPRRQIPINPGTYVTVSSYMYLDEVDVSACTSLVLLLQLNINVPFLYGEVPPHPGLP